MPPSGLLKKFSHWSMDWRLFIKLPSKPFVEDVMRLKGTSEHDEHEQ